MRYDISKASAPKMPNLGKGTECIKILLSQVSKDVREPLVPMLFPSFCAHFGIAEIQRLDHKWRVICSRVANLKQKVVENEGKLSQFAKEN